MDGHSQLPAQHSASTSPDLLSRVLLFGNPERTLVKLSPDGQRISYLAPVNGVLNIWVGTMADLAAAQPVTHETKRGIRHYVWAYTNRHILYPQDENGDENWRIFSVNLDTGEVQALTPTGPVQARIQAVSPELPSIVLVGLNDRVPALHDLYHINLATGERELVLKNEGYSDFVADEQLQVRLALRTTDDGGYEMLHSQHDVPWQPFLTVGPEDSLTTYPLSLPRAASYSMPSTAATVIRQPWLRYDSLRERQQRW